MRSDCLPLPPLLLQNGSCFGDNPTRTTRFGSFMVQPPAQQKLVEHLLGTDSSCELTGLFSLERDALKACRFMDHQMLSIV